MEGEEWEAAMEKYIDCLPGRPEEELFDEEQVNVSTIQLGMAYYNLGNITRKSHLPSVREDHGTRHLDHKKYGFGRA